MQSCLHLNAVRPGPVRPSVARVMHAKRLLLSVVVAGGCVILVVLCCSPKAGRQAVGQALLRYHHQFTTNGYSEVGLRVPDLLRNRYGPAGTIAAETNCVTYWPNGQRRGLHYGQVIYLTRNQPSDTKWTLGGGSGLEVPLWGWVSWRHRSLIVTNGL